MCPTTTLQIPALDGYALAATRFDAPDAPRAVVVVASANGVLRRYYGDFAQHLADSGSVVYTFDYRGIGDSRPASLRGFDCKIETWGELDLAGVLRYARQTHPELPIRLVAHSIGGQILGLAEGAAELERVLLVASSGGYVGHYRGWAKTRVWLSWNVGIPLLTRLFGYFPAKKLRLFEDLPKGVAYQWAQWGRHPEYFMGHLQPAQAQRYAALRMPIHLYSFSDDFFAPLPAAEWLSRQYAQAQVTHKHFKPSDFKLPELGHFNFFRKR